MQASITDREPHSQVRIFIECADLVKMDTFSDSDPYVLVHYRTHPSQPWTQLGKTETLQNNHFPKFSTYFDIPYYFERMQVLRFTVYDADEGGKDDFLGEQEMELAELVTAEQSVMEKPLKLDKVPSSHSAHHKSTIRVSVQELTSSCQYMSQMSAFNLPSHVEMCFFHRPPFPAFRLYETLKGAKKCVAAGELGYRTPQAIFPPCEFLIDHEAEDKVIAEIYDKRPSGKEEVLGEACFSRSVLEGASPRATFPLTLPATPSTPLTPGQQPPTFVIEKSGKVQTFFDYFRQGGSVSLAVGIDFTASNGGHLNAGTLHYQGHLPFIPEARYDANQGVFLYDNPYQRAIHEVVSILEFYDSDHQYPVFGFGAKIPDAASNTGPKLSHCFPISGQQHTPYVKGVGDLFRSYASMVGMVEFWGPTLFAPLIETVVTLVREKAGGKGSAQCKDYTILLIITDGQIMDMDKTKKAIIEASSLPLSIVIVGVGNEDFSSMKALDSDEALLRVTVDQKTLIAQRDIVQFVSMNSLPQGGHEALLRAVLEEIPTQFLEYQKVLMSANSVIPNPV